MSIPKDKPILDVSNMIQATEKLCSGSFPIVDRITADPDRVEAVRSYLNEKVLTNGNEMTVPDAGMFAGVTILNKQVTNDQRIAEDIVTQGLVYFMAKDDQNRDGNGDLKPQANGRRWDTFKKLFGLDISELDKIRNEAGIGYITPKVIGGNTATAPAVKPASDSAQEKAEKRKQKSADYKRKNITPKIEAASPQSQAQPVPDRADLGAPSAPVTVSESETPNVPVVGTPFPSHGYDFLLLRPSEADTRPARKAIIDKYLYENSVSFFFGPASSYKTFWLIWEAIHIATGKELCGMTIIGGARKVLFISLEMTAKDISDRLHNMTTNWTAEEKQLLDENFLIISSEDESRIRATSKNILDALMDICDTYNVGGIYLDAYTEYIVGLDVRSETQGDVINAMRVEANKHHVYFRVIHHSTKSTQTKEGVVDGNMAGIHTIRDTADQVYAMKLLNASLEIRITNDQIKDPSTKPRFCKAITFTVKFVVDEERNTFSFIRLQDNETSSYMDKLRQLLEIVEENQGINSSDLKAKFGDNAVCREVIANATSDKGGRVIIQYEKKSTRGSKMKCHYTSDYYTMHEEEIRGGIL